MGLPNDLIEALTVKLFSNWADSCLSGLSRQKFLIEICLQRSHILSARAIVADILHVMLSIELPLSWWQNGIQNALVVRLTLDWWKVSLLFLGKRPYLLQLNLVGYLIRSFVPHQRISILS